MTSKSICILTPDPSYHEHWTADRDQLDAVIGHGIAYRTWNDASDLTGFDVILPLLAWGYHHDVARWFATLDGWDAQGLPLANSVATLRWNTDKDYLLDLEASGVAIVPTIESHCLNASELEMARARFGVDDLVIKPSISAGADGTYCLRPGQPIPFDVLEREMLIQPMMHAIAEEGEYSLFVFGGVFSHAILKRPAAGDFRVQAQFGGREVAVDPPQSARTLAAAALACAPVPPLYARVDMVRDGEGTFRLMELEMIEPSLFLGFAPDRGAGFAKALAALL